MALYLKNEKKKKIWQKKISPDMNFKKSPSLVPIPLT